MRYRRAPAPRRSGRVEWERTALGGAFVEGEPVWSQPVQDPDRPRVNVVRIAQRLEPLMEHLQARLRLTYGAARAGPGAL